MEPKRKSFGGLFGLAAAFAIFLAAGGLAREEQEGPALLKAVFQGKAAVEAVLLNQPDVRVADPVGVTALHLAAAKGETEIINLLASNGADLDAQTRLGLTPLQVALLEKQATAARRLLELGCRADLADNRGITALHNAARMGDLEIIRTILDRGARVDAASRETGMTPLDIAAAAGKVEVVSYLLEKGAHADHLDLDRSGPLHRACRERHPEVARLLLEKGASPTAAIVEVKLTPLHYAAGTDSVELVELLLKAGADPNAPDVDQNSPLHQAARKGSSEVVQRLLAAGADPARRNASGFTPLHYAAMRGSAEIVDLLLDKGADLEAKALEWIGATPLHLAIEGRRTEAVDRLLARGANVNAGIRNHKDPTEEWTPLTLAETSGNQEIIDLLRHRGARRGQVRFALGTATLALYHVSCDRIGVFPPSDFPPNLLHKWDKLLKQAAGWVSGNSVEVGKFSRGTGAIEEITNLRPVPRADWSSGERPAMDALDAKVAGLREVLRKDLPNPEAGLVLEGVADVNSFYTLLGQVARNPLAVLRKGSRQADRMRKGAEFVAQAFSIAGIRGVLDARGLRLKGVCLAGPKFQELLGSWLTQLKDLPRSSPYLDGDFLFGMAVPMWDKSFSGIPSSVEDESKRKILDKYLQDAGLDFKRDLKPLLEGDITIMANLVPIDGGGGPDLRVIAGLRDPGRLESLGPGLRKFAQSLGVFVASSPADPEALQLSHFVNPQLPIHARRLGRLILAATSAEGLRALGEHIQQVDSGKVPPFVMPPGAEGLFRIRLDQLNEQTQRFSQSPMGKGARALPNQPILQELGTFQFVSQSLPDRFIFQVDLPLASATTPQ